MQINRLFEIVYILLNKKQVTAKELAERFEVSTRTIYRDIESLCEAGVPIYTNKGKGGGICLLDHFVLNKSYLSEKEQKEVLVALQGLKAVPYMPQNEVASKLSALFGNEEEEWITVDFASWDAGGKEKFEMIKKAILEKHYLQFDYYNARLEKLNRKVEPIQLCFKEKTWYLNAYCTVRKQLRLFKLSRIRDIVSLDQTFERRVLPNVLETSDSRASQQNIPIRLWLNATIAHRVFDEFGEENIEIQDDGSFIVTIYYRVDEWLYSYLLSFGHYAKVLAPQDLVEEITKRVNLLSQQYSKVE
ncbi:MAG: YafY family transcriptional regulator [Cellulosilyticum sp.]|nr:YafY family transcriptional regulator [Cellulosilyticum sp.]